MSRINHATLARDPALEAQLRQAVDGTPTAQSLRAFASVSSTMDVARELVIQRAPHMTLVWAARQTQGRGRLGRTWTSPEGGLYCSLILWPLHHPSEIPQLSLVAGLSTAEAIRQSAGLLPSIRWPNDVLLDEKKVCGILVESTDGAVIVGIGINVTTDPHDLPEEATSLAAAGASHCDVLALTGALCRRFCAWYDVWTTQGFGPIHDALRPTIGLFGRVVHLIAGTSRFEGTATDVDEAGRLLVRLDSGIIRPFEMGEVTLLR